MRDSRLRLLYQCIVTQLLKLRPIQLGVLCDHEVDEQGPIRIVIVYMHIKPQTWHI
jgi:hypothetical protein